ncbi:MFS transporter [Kitasatospora sp. NPDC088346]|uniref:MFS transporter n=1 Tax=Kitasatospora sp. NPDC088346 TaxID=3364073 RepID=UPI0037FD4004
MTSPTLHSRPPVTPPPPVTGRVRTLLAGRFGGFDGPFWVVIGGTAMNRVGNMVLPFLVFFLGSRGVATDRIPYVLAALGAGGLVGPVLGGLLTDRYGTRPTLLAGLLATAAGQGLLFAAPGLATLTAAAALLGASGSVYPPAAGAVIAGAVAPARRQIAYGLLHWAVNVGTAVAGALGGFLVVHGYGLLFALDAVTCLAYAALVAARLPREAAGPSRQRGGAGGYRVVLRDRPMLLLLSLSAVAEAVYAQTEFTLPLAVRDHGLPATTFGLAAVVNALLVVTLQPFASVWLARFDRLRVWSFASVLAAVGVGLTGLADSTWEFALTVVVWSAAEVCVGGIVTSIAADLAPAGAQGRFQGALSWSRGLARFAALGGGAAVYAGLGPAVLWWGTALTGVAGALLGLRLAGAVRERMG